MAPRKHTNVEQGTFSNATTNESVEKTTDEGSGSFDREPVETTGREWDDEDVEGTASRTSETEAQDNANLSDETEDRE